MGIDREQRERIVKASTKEELLKNLENISILDLSIAGRKLGVDVDGMSKRMMDTHWAELREAIIKAKEKSWA